MTPRLSVRFTLRAAEHVREAGRWWRANRTKAPAALREELARALQLVTAQPNAGAIARNVRLRGVHRWYGQHPNRVRRTQATRVNQIWVGDLTYLAVAGRWWYLAVVLDQCSRRVLAWRVSAVRDAAFTRAVVDAALRRRRPSAGLIFHSDRGSEFLGTPFRDRLAQDAALQCMTRGGAPDENAHMESFFHALKAELTHGRSFTAVRELRQALRRYLRYYNHTRLHSALGYQSPVDYERAAA